MISFLFTICFGEVYVKNCKNYKDIDIYTKILKQYFLLIKKVTSSKIIIADRPNIFQRISVYSVIHIPFTVKKFWLLNFVIYCRNLDLSPKLVTLLSNLTISSKTCHFLQNVPKFDKINQIWTQIYKIHFCGN